MKEIGFATALMLALATPSWAMDAEKEQRLFEQLETALQCYAISGYLKATLPEARAKLYYEIISTGRTIGDAMFDGTSPETNLSNPRRCLTRFNFSAQPDLPSLDRITAISFTLGQSEACFGQLHVDQIFQNVQLTTNMAGGNTREEVNDRAAIAEYNLGRFAELGCGGR